MIEAELKVALKGVETERGAVVTCRDPSAMEMLLRLSNTDANQGSVSAIFQKASHLSAGGASGQMVFVNEKYAHTLEEEVQSWLDPFKNVTAATAASPTTAAKERKRHRGDTESDESSFDSAEDSD